MLRGVTTAARCVTTAATSSRTRPFVILSLDGGGVRGLLEAALLARLEKRTPGLVARVDLFAGTSTGAILALMLAHGYSPAECSTQYARLIPHVFGKPRPLLMRPFRAKYETGPLREQMHACFGDATLGELERDVVITALRVDGAASHTTSPELWRGHGDSWRPAVFSNLPPIVGVAPDLALKIADAALRSSAAPTYFPSYQGYVDGGMWANNPSMVATTKALMHFPRLRRRNVRVLSLGAGAWPMRLSAAPGAELDIGLTQWAPHLVDLLLDASSLTTDMSASFLLRKNYHRFCPSFDLPVAIDQCDTINRLLHLAETVDIEDTVAFVNRVFKADSDADAHDRLVKDGSGGAPQNHDDSDDSGDHEQEHFEVIGGSSSSLSTSAWTDLVDQAWINKTKADAIRNIK